ncbi:MAG: hypothetical protein IJR55_03015 [Clostridia bacterium]|nr:hypothetical protein [Clostridia bacterium]
MILEPKKIMMAYRCPQCATTVKSAVGVLDLSGDLLKLKCSCGGSEMHITKTSDGKYRFTVPCLFCGNDHSFVISRNTLVAKELFTVPCSYAGVDILFIGDEEKVSDAINESDKQLSELLEENELEELREQNKNDEAYGDAHLQDLIIFTLRELNEDGQITCACKDGGEYVCEPNPDSVRVYCKKCGYERNIACHEGSLSAHILFDCDTFPLLPPEEE